jgi:thiamine biosynthesis lipoprotein
MTAETIWRALGTTVHLLVADGDPAIARGAVEATLARVDATYSRFRPDSELSRLHALPRETVRVSDLLARAIGDARRAAAATDGLVDPTVGRAVRATGYDADFASARGRVAMASGLGRGAGPLATLPGPAVRIESVPGWQAVRLDAAARTVRLPRGVELDLGSTGKALAAELAADAASERLGPDAGVLVSLGGDIAVAGRTPPGGWQVAVGEDSRAAPRDVAEVVSLETGGMATSSTTVRRWHRDGVDVHHIVDPRTGVPAAGPWRTATVAARTCTDANAASTAAIVRGADAPSWLASLGLPARLVGSDGSVVRVGGWPDPASGTLRPAAAGRRRLAGARPKRTTALSPATQQPERTAA